MTFRSTLPLRNNSSRAIEVVLEPYASEFALAPGGVSEVVGTSDKDQPEFEVECTDKGIVVWGVTTAAVYEYWQDGKCMD